MVAWCIWYNRSALHLEKERQACEAILHKAKILLEEFQMANFSMAQPRPQYNVHWEAPEPPWNLYLTLQLLAYLYLTLSLLIMLLVVLRCWSSCKIWFKILSCCETVDIVID